LHTYCILSYGIDSVIYSMVCHLLIVVQVFILYFIFNKEFGSNIPG